MPRDAVSRTANVERNGGHKWVNKQVKTNISAKFDGFICVENVSVTIPLTIFSEKIWSLVIFNGLHG